MLKLKLIEDFQYNDFWTRGSFKQTRNQNQYNLNSFHVIKDDKFNIFFYLEHDYSKDFSESTFFPIFMRNGNQPEQLSLVSAYIKKNSKLFKDKKLIPIIMDPLEGHEWLPVLVEKLSDEVKDICIIYYVDGNKRNESLTKVKFYYSYMWLYSIACKQDYIKNTLDYDNTKVNLSTNHKIFICLNRLAREHRLRLISSFIKNDVRKYGYISWTGHPGLTGWQEYFPEIVRETFDVLDVVEIYRENPTNKFPTEFCKDSFIFVNTETTFDNRSMFLSEKVFKPIILGMPFILLGNPGVLLFLKQLGFKTFEKWIDESYDNDTALEERCEIITKEIKRFAEMNPSQRIQLRNEMHETTQHNITVLDKLSQTSDMYNILLDIKDSALSKS